MKKSLKVNCPTCKKVFHYYDSGFRPFCCERCKMVDLGHWFEENYSVAGEKVGSKTGDMFYEQGDDESDGEHTENKEDENDENEY